MLGKSGVTAEAIHGNKSQPQRERVLAAFRAGRLRNLVATDIAARGIDVTGISHVFNYDMPNDPESYVHRIGRTARAGRAGTAISFCSADELPLLRSIEKLIRREIGVSPGGEVFDQAVPAKRARASPGVAPGAATTVASGPAAHRVAATPPRGSALPRTIRRAYRNRRGSKPA